MVASFSAASERDEWAPARGGERVWSLHAPKQTEHVQPVSSLGSGPDLSRNAEAPIIDPVLKERWMIRRRDAPSGAQRTRARGGRGRHAS